jgi:hypothetical protein
LRSRIPVMMNLAGQGPAQTASSPRPTRPVQQSLRGHQRQNPPDPTPPL